MCTCRLLADVSLRLCKYNIYERGVGRDAVNPETRLQKEAWPASSCDRFSGLTAGKCGGVRGYVLLPDGGGTVAWLLDEVRPTSPDNRGCVPGTIAKTSKCYALYSSPNVLISMHAHILSNEGKCISILSSTVYNALRAINVLTHFDLPYPYTARYIQCFRSVARLGKGRSDSRLED